MNKQKPPHGIEWTRVYGRDGYTWNPTGGCRHGCAWKMPNGAVVECYAKTVAEGLAASAYPQGFAHHYWRPDALPEPLSVKSPSGIFVGSMADLFGHWVPPEQIEAVMGVMKAASWHTFMTLSKYPVRIPDFNPFPPNVWVGVSLPAGYLLHPDGGRRALGAYLRHMVGIKAAVRFMSIEPLWFDVAPVFEAWLSWGRPLPFEWVIIGAASDGRRTFQPERAWVQNLLAVLDGQRIPVFFKGNLDWTPHRAMWPGDVWATPPLPAPTPEAWLQLALWG